MKSSVMLHRKYSKEIPEDITQIIAALDDPIRRAIMVLLTKNTEITFSDIKRELGLPKLTLNYHLKNLYSAGLTDHYFRHELGNQKYSYYAITTLGKRVLLSLFEALVPPIPFQKSVSENTLRDYEHIPTAMLVCVASYSGNRKREMVRTFDPACVDTGAASLQYPTNTSTYNEAE